MLPSILFQHEFPELLFFFPIFLEYRARRFTGGEFLNLREVGFCAKEALHSKSTAVVGSAMALFMTSTHVHSGAYSERLLTSTGIVVSVRIGLGVYESNHPIFCLT